MVVYEGRPKNLSKCFLNTQNSFVRYKEKRSEMIMSVIKKIARPFFYQLTVAMLS